MEQRVMEKARKVLEKPVCDHCLGRQFAQLLTGRSNELRGAAIREVFAMRLDSGEDLDVDISNFSGHRFHRTDRDVPDEREECEICGEVFQEVEDWVSRALEELEDMNFETLMVGTKLSPELVTGEEELWEEAGIEWTEPLKGELNRLVGARIQEELGKEADLERPDVVVLLNTEDGEIELEINSLYLYGEYNKYASIPQTRWPSDKYETSVEEIVAEPFVEAAEGSGHKFHGMGREDIDARCLGWRPFVLEVLEPRNRDLKVLKLQRQLKDREEIDVKNMEIVGADMVEKVKTVNPDKRYRAVVELSEPVTREQMAELDNLEGKEIYQETPQRVSHRRANKLRRRKVKELKYQRIGDKEEKKLKMWITAEAGTYIKELISGDDGRTYPSVSGLLGVDAECEQLDVLDVLHDDEFRE